MAVEKAADAQCADALKRPDAENGTIMLKRRFYNAVCWRLAVMKDRCLNRLFLPNPA